MKSHEALNRAINRNTVEVARALHLSTSSVNKWQEPSTDFSDSGSYNPLDRIETIIEKSLDLGISFEDATAPIQYLAERFGFICIQMPQTKANLSELSQELLKTITEFGHLAQESSAALEDDIINRMELTKITKEAWDLIRQVGTFLQKVQECSK
jgi:hypothetical protein